MNKKSSLLSSLLCCAMTEIALGFFMGEAEIGFRLMPEWYRGWSGFTLSIITIIAAGISFMVYGITTRLVFPIFGVVLSAVILCLLGFMGNDIQLSSVESNIFAAFLVVLSVGSTVLGLIPRAPSFNLVGQSAD